MRVYKGNTKKSFKLYKGADEVTGSLYVYERKGTTTGYSGTFKTITVDACTYSYCEVNVGADKTDVPIIMTFHPLYGGSTWGHPQHVIDYLQRSNYQGLVIAPQASDAVNEAVSWTLGRKIDSAFYNGGPTALGYNVNNGRYCIAGFSMGGMHMYDALYQNPNKYAAVAAYAGGSSDLYKVYVPEPKRAAVNTDFQIINGDADEAVDYKSAVNYATKIHNWAEEDLGKGKSKVKITVVKGATHADILYDWKDHLDITNRMYISALGVRK